MAKNHWARREMRRHWRHLFFPNARQPGTHKHTHRDETSSIPFYTACKIYINMSVASLTDGQIVPGLLRFCRRLSKCPKGGGGINSALAGLAGILHIGWRWERKNEHRSYTYLIFPRLSLMCVPSHCIPNLLRLSFLLFTPVSRVSVPFTRDQQHTSSGTSPPPLPPSLSSDGAVPIDDSLSLLRQGQSRQSPWHFSKRKADCCCCPTRVRALLQQLTMDRSAH
jgi:hypothetical protein